MSLPLLILIIALVCLAPVVILVGIVFLIIKAIKN